MPIVFADRGPIVFVHVPKTGGTSVEDYLARRFGPLFLTDINKREKVAGTSLLAAVNHLSAIDLREMIPAHAILVFALVRDPLARALSEYRWQSGASRLSRMDFSTWLRVAVAAARREPRLYGNHIRPQSEMVPEGAEVFRLEDGFEALVARLDAVTGTTAPEIAMGHFKARRDKAAKIPVYRQDAALIAEYYAPDYDRFGFPRPDPGDYPADPAALRRRLAAAPLARLLVAKQHRDWVRAH